MFITFEGIDGSGKTTQLELLATQLRADGHDVVVTRDPGGTAIGQALRQIVLHHPGFVSPLCELFLYIADRAQHVAEVIRPALERGAIVLCDRYVDSTMAYQGGGRGLDINEIAHLNTLATGGLLPDRTFFFDAPVPVLLDRAKKRGPIDRLESETIAFYERVRQGYLALVEGHPERIILLDAENTIETLARHVRAVLPMFTSV